MATSLPSGRASRYERLCGGAPGINPGIDPYTRLAANLYQDLFDEGSFIGKGIYEVDTAMRVLGERLPDNTVLSHDLLEGCYLRSGVLGDTQLAEAWPARYSDDIARRHRNGVCACRLGCCTLSIDDGAIDLIALYFFRDAVHCRNGFNWILARRTFSREHDGIRAFKNGRRHIGDFSACWHGR